MILTRRALLASVAAGTASLGAVSLAVPSGRAQPEPGLPSGLWRSRSTAEIVAVEGRSYRCYTVYSRVLALVEKERTSDIEKELLAVRTDGTADLELEYWAPVTRTAYDRLSEWPAVPRLDRERGWLPGSSLTVEAFFEMLKGHFAFAAERGIDWAALRTECDATLSRDARSPDRLFDALAAALRHLQDGHGSLRGHDRRAESRRAVPRVIQAWNAARDSVIWGRLASGVGYLALMRCERLSKGAATSSPPRRRSIAPWPIWPTRGA